MTLIHYDGEIVATASPLRVHFAPPLDDRPAEDPLRRFVHAMALYARDVAAGELRGPYRDEDAELYARTYLIDDQAFAAHAGESDEQLARHFGVPLDQIAHKRRNPPRTQVRNALALVLARRHARAQALVARRRGGGGRF